MNKELKNLAIKTAKNSGVTKGKIELNFNLTNNSVSGSIYETMTQRLGDEEVEIRLKRNLKI